MGYADVKEENIVLHARVWTERYVYILSIESLNNSRILGKKTKQKNDHRSEEK